MNILKALRFHFSQSEHVIFENLIVCVECKILYSSSIVTMDSAPSTPKTPKTPGSARKRSASFRLELPGGDALASTIRQKMVTLKEKFRAKDQRLNNAEIIERALDALLHSAVESPDFSLPDVKVEDTSYFICTDSAIARLLQSAHHHNSACQNQLSFRPEQTLMCGTVAVFHLSCSSGHTFSWSSSVYLSNGTFLANAR